MVKVEVKVLSNNLPKISASMRPRAAIAIGKTCQDILTTTRESMQGPKTGRIYKRGSKDHQASAEGEPPAVDYSTLVNSIQDYYPSQTRGIVATDVEYAPALEFGSINMGKRPFFVPAAEKSFPGFIEAMTQIVKGG